MAKVLVACCNGDGWIHKLVAFAAMRMVLDDRHEVRFIAPTHSPYVHNLHKVVNEFLAGDHDYLLLMDDDNPPEAWRPLDLVDMDLDVVGLPTPVWHNAVPGDRPYYYNALAEKRLPSGGLEGLAPADSLPGFVGEGLQEVDAVGTGCVLIARRVLAELMARAEGDPMEAPFMRRWNDRGEVELGNDFAFCQRARAAGFRIWAHWGYTCLHFNELNLQEVISAFSEAKP